MGIATDIIEPLRVSYSIFPPQQNHIRDVDLLIPLLQKGRTRYDTSPHEQTNTKVSHGIEEQDNIIYSSFPPGFSIAGNTDRIPFRNTDSNLIRSRQASQ